LYDELVVDVAVLSLAGQMRTAHLSHRRDEGEVRIFPHQAAELVQEWSVLRTSIGVEKEDPMWQLFICGSPHDAAEWGDADPACQENCRPTGIVVQCEITERALDLDLGPERHRLQRALEGSISQARGERQLGILRCAVDGEAAGVSLRVRFRRVDQREVHELAGLEGHSSG